MNEIHCPFCLKVNSCNVQSRDCWCHNESIPEALFELLPVDSKNKSCICWHCIRLFNENEQAFKERLNGKAK
ncbi:hypothetical protein CW745_02540 [Psychromonas sp. psych-6C06]|nr:hypothetical protein CW745_02540 [Psychromonas sp. psych-6C06]